MKKSLIFAAISIIAASCTESQYVPETNSLETFSEELRNDTAELSSINLYSDKDVYLAGDRAVFTAEAVFSDGYTADITELCIWESWDGCQNTDKPGTFLIDGSEENETFEVNCHYTYNGKRFKETKTCGITLIKESIETSAVTTESTNGELTLTINDPSLKGWTVTSDDDFLKLTAENTGKGNATITGEYDTAYVGGKYNIYVLIGSEQYKTTIERTDAPKTEQSVDYWCFAELTGSESAGWDNPVPGGKAAVKIHFELSEPALTDMTVTDNHGNRYLIRKGECRSSETDMNFNYIRYDNLTPGSIYPESITPSQITVCNEDKGIITYRYNFDF